jgi:hypothetical protein
MGLYRTREQIELRAVGEGQNRTADWIGLAAFWALVPLAAWDSFGCGGGGGRCSP